MRILLLCLVTIGGVLGTGHLVSGEQQTKDAPDSEGSSREADRAAFLQSGRDFTTAFEKGDAKAVAALWTEQGEYESDAGPILRGRSAIEAAFAVRFKDRPAGKLEITVENIRFPSRDIVLEAGNAHDGQRHAAGLVALSHPARPRGWQVADRTLPRMGCRREPPG